MTTPTDDRELLRTLATACGWKISVTDNTLYHFAHETQGAFTIGSESSDEAWATLLRITSAPDWLHSIDAAMGLPWPTGYELAIDIEQGISYVVMWPDGKDASIDYKAEGKSLARALSETFYAWTKAQEAGK